MFTSHLDLLPEAKILFLTFYFTLIAIALIDYSNFLIPEQITLPLILVGLVSSASNILPIQLEDSVYGLVVPGIFAVGIWTIQRILKFANLAKENPLIGTGDYYLLSACGVWFGLQNLGYIVCFMALFSFVFAIIFRTRNIPLGVPVLLAAITLFFKHA
jgi:Type IV leader peptidase family.